jgi:hypothetical protein
MTTYMVIETFKEGCADAVYQRFHERGRLLPPGLLYIDSWREKNGNRCFQLMETTDPKLFHQWTRRWDDLVDFEVIELVEKP